MNLSDFEFHRTSPYANPTRRAESVLVVHKQSRRIALVSDELALHIEASKAVEPDEPITEEPPALRSIWQSHGNPTHEYRVVGHLLNLHDQLSLKLETRKRESADLWRTYSAQFAVDDFYRTFFQDSPLRTAQGLFDYIRAPE